jgi:hypothetical protein
MQMKPRVFISHSSKDKAFVRVLVDELTQAGVKTWFDERALEPGDLLFQKISDGIRDTDYFLFVISKHSVRSRWVMEELSAAFQRQIDDAGAVIIPIRLDDSEVPILISNRLYIDFRNFRAGLGRLLEFLLTEDSVARIFRAFGRGLGLSGDIPQEFRAAHCESNGPDLYTKFYQTYSEGDIRRLLFDQLDFEELRALYSDTFSDELCDLGEKRPKIGYTNDIIARVRRENAMDKLIREMCKSFWKRLR